MIVLVNWTKSLEAKYMVCVPNVIRDIAEKMYAEGVPSS